MPISKQLNASQQAVLEFLRTYRDPRDGQCTPTNKAIATAVGLTADTVSDITATLVKSGHIEKTPGWEYCPDAGERWVFTTDRWEAESSAYMAGEWHRGPNLFKVVGVLLLFVVLWPTVAAASSPSVLEALCYKTLLGLLLVVLAKIFFRGTIRCSDCGRDFPSEKAFQQHDCAPEDIDYLVGTNLWSVRHV